MTVVMFCHFCVCSDYDNFNDNYDSLLRLRFILRTTDVAPCLAHIIIVPMVMILEGSQPKKLYLNLICMYACIWLLSTFCIHDIQGVFVTGTPLKSKSMENLG